MLWSSKTNQGELAMKKKSERRRRNRWQVAVLVRCSIPKLGDETFELEMWARDVNEDGLKLEMTQGLNISRVLEDGESAQFNKPFRMEDVEFKKGMTIKIQDLFYDDEGSPFMNGTVTWARRTPNGWALGIQFLDKKTQSKAMLGAFKDFLKVVKNPLDAIEKASRKN
jgi:hypothetical protein